VTPPEKQIVLEKTPFVVPEAYEGYGHRVIPMHAGETLDWSVTEVIT